MTDAETAHWLCRNGILLPLALGVGGGVCLLGVVVVVVVVLKSRRNASASTVNDRYGTVEQDQAFVDARNSMVDQSNQNSVYGSAPPLNSEENKTVEKFVKELVRLHISSSESDIQSVRSSTSAIFEL